jgi:L-alanine-DL-glutamate epimerase-like enolase superfamily enzyme
VTLAADFERVELPLEHDFTIARGTQSTAENVLVRITDDRGRTGVGAAAPSGRYGETPATVTAVLPDLLAAVESVGDPLALQRIEREMADLVAGNGAARCAVDVALHDLAATQLDLPLYRYLGLDPERSVTTSFTVGLDDTERMREKAAAAADAGYPILKVKLGTDRDREVVGAVRDAAPDATIRVDANEAWTPREAVTKTRWLAEAGVEFVEQPVPADDPDGLAFVRERGDLPVAADESCVTLADVPQVAGAADIATIKLTKAGGLRETVRMIHAARAHGLAVMLGCMIASDALMAAGAHLAPLLDYADLDGSLLLADDPYEGVPMSDGRIELAALDGPGTGARPGD